MTTPGRAQELAIERHITTLARTRDRVVVRDRDRDARERVGRGADRRTDSRGSNATRLKRDHRPASASPC